MAWMRSPLQGPPRWPSGATAACASSILPRKRWAWTASRTATCAGKSAGNTAALTALLAGETGPYRDIVLLNAAAAFLVADRAETLREGMDLAADSIDSGGAARALGTLIAVTGSQA